MNFIQSYPLIIPFITILLAEFTKAFIDVFTKRHSIRFIKPGGMPSGHSAFVTSLVVVVANRDGVESTVFMIAAAFALIVMYDAINLRGQVGEHAKMLNKLDPSAGLEESLGHNKLEVIVGATFGAIVALLFLIV